MQKSSEGAYRCLDAVVGRDARHALLGELTLEDLLFDGAGADHSVQVALLLLPIAPHARRGLLVVGRVPIGVEENEPVAPDQVEPTASRFGRE